MPERISLTRADMDFPKKNLNEKINDMNKEERKKVDESIAQAFCQRTKAAKS